VGFGGARADHFTVQTRPSRRYRRAAIRTPPHEHRRTLRSAARRPDAEIGVASAEPFSRD
jgi:hypothetical protein